MPGKAIVYVDGYNLYYGLKEASLRKCYWLDLFGLATSLAAKRGLPVECKYFTSLIQSRKDDKVLVDLIGKTPKLTPEMMAAMKQIKKAERQEHYINALSKHNESKQFKIIHGTYKTSDRLCSHCSKLNRFSHEKQTDVNIALEIVKDVVQEEASAIYVVSGDSDLTPALKLVRELNDGREREKSVFIAVVCPPRRKSDELCSQAHVKLALFEKLLMENLLPEKFGKFEKPEKWK